ncbi:ROK family protein, partial [Streptomyces sp. NPDC059083]|uniref:ROK family protein n=1 Tax=Streptomyces sp. NPDC059083 TaxID=3346721 RepID=UPI00368932E6
MTLLALAIGDGQFIATQIAAGVGAEQIGRIPQPTRDAWPACRDLLLDKAAGTSVSAVGIACSGPIDMATGVVAPTEIPEWRTGFGIVEAVRKTFPSAEVYLALDGVCLAFAERNFGASRDVLDSVVISASDHVSGALVIGGYTAVGRTGNAGNFGHTLVPRFDEPCECGGRGCLESVAGGAAMLRWARTQGWQGDSATELVGAANQGDRIALAAVDRAGTALGSAIASVAALLDIDLVVVGGSLALPGSALWRPLGKAITEHAKQSYLTTLRVIPSALGAEGVLVGAGVL